MARESSVSDICGVLALHYIVVSRRVIKHCLCISREISTVPSLYRPSTDGLITWDITVCNTLSAPLRRQLARKIPAHGPSSTKRNELIQSVYTRSTFVSR